MPYVTDEKTGLGYHKSEPVTVSDLEYNALVNLDAVVSTGLDEYLRSQIGVETLLRRLEIARMGVESARYVAEAEQR